MVREIIMEMKNFPGQGISSQGNLEKNEKVKEFQISPKSC